MSLKVLFLPVPASSSCNNSAGKRATPFSPNDNVIGLLTRVDSPAWSIFSHFAASLVTGTAVFEFVNKELDIQRALVLTVGLFW